MDTSALWEKYKISPSDELKKQIILNYMNLVHYVIHNSKFFNRGIFDDKDYFQFGTEGLMEAINRFDPNFGTKFETYAIQRIRGKIIDEIRKVQIKPYPRSGEESKYENISINTPSDENEGYMLYEVLPDKSEGPDEATEKNETKEIFLKIIKQLDERDKLILLLYYYENLSYKEIAEKLHISIPHVSKIHTRIIGDMRSKLAHINT